MFQLFSQELIRPVSVVDAWVSQHDHICYLRCLSGRSTRGAVPRMINSRDSRALAAPIRSAHRGGRAPHRSVCIAHRTSRVVVVLVVVVVHRHHSSRAARPRRARGPAQSKRASPPRRRSRGSSPRPPLAAAAPHPLNRINSGGGSCSSVPAWTLPLPLPPPRVSCRYRASSRSRSTSCGRATPGIPKCSTNPRRVASPRPRYSTSSEDVVPSRSRAAGPRRG